MGRCRGAGVHGETVTAVDRGNALPHGLLGVVEVGLAAQEGASHGCRVQREPPQGRESIGAIRDDGGAEDAGVDPTRYYTTRSLGEAFLAACDKPRVKRFAPLFAGSGNAADAARAALLPNTFLQALVYETLTGPAVPEVIEE